MKGVKAKIKSNPNFIHLESLSHLIESGGGEALIIFSIHNGKDL